MLLKRRFFHLRETVEKNSPCGGSEAGCLLARVPQEEKLFPSLNEISNELSTCGFGQC